VNAGDVLGALFGTVLACAIDVGCLAAGVHIGILFGFLLGFGLAGMGAVIGHGSYR